MTAIDILQTVRRRWYLALVGLVATFILVGLAASVRGVYYQQADVVFLAPDLPQRVNAYQVASSSLISTAGLIGREVSDPAVGPLPVSPRVTLVDLGIRRGVLVRIPDEGGQWAHNFARPVLSVEIVGDDPLEVRARMTTTLSLIRKTLRDEQRAARVPADLVIETTQSPPTPPVLYQGGSRSRAAGASALLGLGLTVALTVGVDGWLTRRGLTRRGSPAGQAGVRG